jgi:hypothetical protein
MIEKKSLAHQHIYEQYMYDGNILMMRTFLCLLFGLTNFI